LNVFVQDDSKKIELHCLQRDVLPVLWAVMLIAGQIALYAQSIDCALAPKAVSLIEARHMAFHRNWDLLGAQSDVDIAAAERSVAKEFPNPTASLSSTKWGDHSGSTPSGNSYWDRDYDTVTAVSQLLEIGGKRRARQESAQAGVQNAEARLADARRLLKAGVTQAYVAALVAARKQGILNDSAVSLRQEATIAEVRQRTGDISSTDKHQIEIAAERLELDAAAVQADAHNARVALEALLGEAQPQGNIMLTDTLESLVDWQGDTLPAQCNVSDRPDIVAAEAVRSKTRADLQLQRAMRIPDPTLLIQYEHAPPDQPNTVGVGVSFPLPFWNFNKGNIAAAQAAREQADIQLGKIRAQVVTDIATAQISYTAALARWHRCRDELMPKSHDVRESVSLAYQKGSASLLDLLSAQRNDNDIRLETIQAAADAANALAALQAAINEPESSVSSNVSVPPG